MENETTMRDVKTWEHSSTNSGEYIIAHLSCGHTRTFNGNRPVGKGQVRCWDCDRNAARRARHQAMLDLGLKRVKGALGGVYYE